MSGARVKEQMSRTQNALINHALNIMANRSKGQLLGASAKERVARGEQLGDLDSTCRRWNRGSVPPDSRDSQNVRTPGPALLTTESVHLR